MGIAHDHVESVPFDCDHRLRLEVGAGLPTHRRFPRPSSHTVNATAAARQIPCVKEVLQPRAQSDRDRRRVVTHSRPDEPAVDPANGLAAAPLDAPPEVQNAIWAANTIIGLPYVYGGGHRPASSARGYDCSGTVSFALHGANLLRAPLDSGSFMRWGLAGKGDWFTVYTNPGHAFAVIAGLRLDTSAAGDRGGLRGPRWRPVLRSTRGFKARHPLGF